MLYHRRHRRHRRHHPQQQHVNVCFLLDSPHQLHAINVAPAFKNNVRGGSWHEPTKKGKKTCAQQILPQHVTTTLQQKSRQAGKFNLCERLYDAH